MKLWLKFKCLHSRKLAGKCKRAAIFYRSRCVKHFGNSTAIRTLCGKHDDTADLRTKIWSILVSSGTLETLTAGSDSKSYTYGYPGSSFTLLLWVFRGARSNQHDDIPIWKRFPHYWPFVRGIHLDLRWIALTKGQKFGPFRFLCS